MRFSSHTYNLGTQFTTIWKTWWVSWPLSWSLIRPNCRACMLAWPTRSSRRPWIWANWTWMIVARILIYSIQVNSVECPNSNNQELKACNSLCRVRKMLTPTTLIQHKIQWLPRRWTVAQHNSHRKLLRVVTLVTNDQNWLIKLKWWARIFWVMHRNQ